MKLAVVGNPISHSKSPLIFRYLFDAENLEYSYEKLLLLSVDEIPQLFKNEYNGINITAPFKQSVIPFLDELAEDAKRIGSVNTVILKDNRLIGYNTDYLGVVNSLESFNIDLTGKKCLILGAGGAARAAIYGLKLRNAKIQVFNRTTEKAESLAKEFDIEQLKQSELGNAVAKAEILIDTLPAGIHIVKPELLHAGLTILDASYPKSVYPKNADYHFIGGEYWLMHQALPAFALFTRKQINKTNFDQKALIRFLNEE
jgi:shikimate dehydrogenase